MSAADLLVVAAAALLAWLGWYFFRPKQAELAHLRDGVQEIEVTVKGGYWRR